jgi:energy-coupling factor transporter ATP-binding protein EcfA2
MTAIEAVGLKKAFGPGRAAGRVQALDGLGLSVPRGTVCALLGPNGAGKTTAVRILATLTKPRRRHRHRGRARRDPRTRKSTRANRPGRPARGRRRRPDRPGEPVHPGSHAPPRPESRQLDAAGVAAEDVSLRRPTLDEVFLDRTSQEAMA